jgi:UDP-N-acetylglucosamine 3-dehydrogenase
MNIGIIGAGSMGQNHVRVAKDVAGSVAVFDTDKARVDAMVSKFGAKPYYDYTAMLGDKEIDAVVIVTPTSTHMKVASEAIDAGKHVLCEKPISDDPNEAQKIVDKAKAHGITFGVGHIERHNPAVGYAKKALDSKQFGDVVSLSSRRVSSLPGRIRDVGCILDIGIHDIDTMNYLAGAPESVYCSAGTKTKGISVEDHANILINYKNGITASLEISWLTPMKVRKLWLTCDKAYVEMDYIDQMLTISTSSLPSFDPSNLFNIPLEVTTQKIALRKQEPLKNEIVDFIEAIKNKRKPLIGGDEAILNVKVAKAAIESYKTGKEISL